MCVLIRTESMHSALLFSMKPMPPILHARLYTSAAPSTAASQLDLRFKSSCRLSTSSNRWYHSGNGFTSTARRFVCPCRSSPAIKEPPMKPPAPATTISSFFIRIWLVPLPEYRNRSHQMRSGTTPGDQPRPNDPEYTTLLYLANVPLE